jgi:hypothetical protein
MGLCRNRHPSVPVQMTIETTAGGRRRGSGRLSLPVRDRRNVRSGLSRSPLHIRVMDGGGSGPAIPSMWS